MTKRIAQELRATVDVGECKRDGCTERVLWVTHTKGQQLEYHSPECKLAVRAAEKRAERQAKAAVRPALEERECAARDCNKRFVPPVNMPSKRFHSTPCSLRANAGRDAVREERKCALDTCGKAFMPKRKDQTCCTTAHQKRAKELRRARYEIKPITVVCDVCEKPFVHDPLATKGRTPKRCSEACKKVANAKRQAADAAFYTVICDVCGREFVREPHPGPRAVRCEGECTAVVQRRANQASYAKFLTRPADQVAAVQAARREARDMEKRRASGRRAQALRRGGVVPAYATPFTREEIYLRDEETCQLCFRSVDVTLPAGTPMSPTLDHIIPKSKGGADSRANLQLAHWGCNSRKGNRRYLEVAA